MVTVRPSLQDERGPTEFNPRSHSKKKGRAKFVKKQRGVKNWPLIYGKKKGSKNLVGVLYGINRHFLGGGFL